MLAVRPNYHSPSLTAKALSTLSVLAPDRVSLNVVSSWWKDEATQYGAPFDVHDARYARTEEWMGLVQRLLTEDTVTHHGELYDLEGCILEPKPAALPTFYMGGESPKAKEVISRYGTAYVMHGDPPEVIAGRSRDMSARAAEHGKTFPFGVSGYVIVRDSEAEAQEELARILDVKARPRRTPATRTSSPAASSSRRCRSRSTASATAGLRAGLVGTPAQVTERIRAYEDAGVDLVLLQFSPQREEMARFGRDVIASYR